jgi:hypothetical protein
MAFIGSLRSLLSHPDLKSGALSITVTTVDGRAHTGGVQTVFDDGLSIVAGPLISYLPLSGIASITFKHPTPGVADSETT